MIPALHGRAIALTSIFAKLYERILLARLTTWLRSSRLWLLPQFGFRSGCSTLHAVFLLRTLVLDVLRVTKMPVHVAYVDLKKAFPSVDRDSLFRRLLDLGVPIGLVSAIQSFYVINSAKLRVDNNLSTAFIIALGVLEGSVLSPCLFATLFTTIWDLFSITDFPSIGARVFSLDNLWFIAFADDLVIVTLSKEKLEAVLNRLHLELSKLNLNIRLLLFL